MELARLDLLMDLSRNEEEMKKIDLEESLKMAFAYDRVGCADCLHAASPCVLKVEVAVERLREIGRASGR